MQPLACIAPGYSNRQNGLHACCSASAKRHLCLNTQSLYLHCAFLLLHDRSLLCGTQTLWDVAGEAQMANGDSKGWAQGCA